MTSDDWHCRCTLASNECLLLHSGSRALQEGSLYEETLQTLPDDWVMYAPGDTVDDMSFTTSTSSSSVVDQISMFDPLSSNRYRASSCLEHHPESTPGAFVTLYMTSDPESGHEATGEARLDYGKHKLGKEHLVIRATDSSSDACTLSKVLAGLQGRVAKHHALQQRQAAIVLVCFQQDVGSRGDLSSAPMQEGTSFKFNELFQTLKLAHDHDRMQ